jgi:hypothetical protein
MWDPPCRCRYREFFNSGSFAKRVGPAFYLITRRNKTYPLKHRELGAILGFIVAADTNTPHRSTLLLPHCPSSFLSNTGAIPNNPFRHTLERLVSPTFNCLSLIVLRMKIRTQRLIKCKLRNSVFLSVSCVCASLSLSLSLSPCTYIHIPLQSRISNLIPYILKTIFRLI